MDNFCLRFLLSCFLLLPALSFAAESYELSIINHYNKPLDFTISINPEVIPNLPVTFTVNVNTIVKANIFDLQKEAYLLAEDETQKNLAFWGVEIAFNTIKLHGYTSKGLAYSFNSESIIFCTPEDYQVYGFCK